jgi:hypothetical protein
MIRYTRKRSPTIHSPTLPGRAAFAVNEETVVLEEGAIGVVD